MEANHHDNNGIIGVVMWLSGIFCMAVSNAQPSEVRAWITFSLGAAASITSIVVNYPKLKDAVKGWKAKKKKRTHGK